MILSDFTNKQFVRRKVRHLDRFYFNLKKLHRFFFLPFCLKKNPASFLTFDLRFFCSFQVNVAQLKHDTSHFTEIRHKRSLLQFSQSVYIFHEVNGCGYKSFISHDALQSSMNSLNCLIHLWKSADLKRLDLNSKNI